MNITGNQSHLGNVFKVREIFTFSTESVNVSHRLFHFQMTDVVRNQRICYTARKREKFLRELANDAKWISKNAA